MRGRPPAVTTWGQKDLLCLLDLSHSLVTNALSLHLGFRLCPLPAAWPWGPGPGASLCLVFICEVRRTSPQRNKK